MEPVTELVNCDECGKVFAAKYRKVCHECVNRLQEEYQQVREYLRNHPLATIHDVMIHTGLQYGKVSKMVEMRRNG